MEKNFGWLPDYHRAWPLDTKVPRTKWTQFYHLKWTESPPLKKHYETNAFQITRIGKRKQISMLRINNSHCIAVFSDSHMKIFRVASHNTSGLLLFYKCDPRGQCMSPDLSKQTGRLTKDWSLKLIAQVRNLYFKNFGPCILTSIGEIYASLLLLAGSSWNAFRGTS